MAITISVAPSLSRLRAKFTKRPLFKDLADRKITICPASQRWERGAISLSDEFSRVRKARHYDSLFEQSNVLKEGKREHLPTISYLYKNTLIAHGVIYFKNDYEIIAKQRRKPIVLANAESFGEAICCADMGSDLFFGRWLCDALAKELFAEEQGCVAINQENTQRIHEEKYRDLLSLDARKPVVGVVKNLLLLDDRGYNQDHVRRFEILRDRIRSRYFSGVYERIYISRGKLAETGRDIANNEEFTEKVRSLGFHIIHPESMSATEICRTLAGAKIVAGIEGSALAHALMAMPEGAVLLTIQPASRFSSILKSVAECVDISFAYIVADDSRGVGLMVDLGRFEKTVDLLST